MSGKTCNKCNKFEDQKDGHEIIKFTINRNGMICDRCLINKDYEPPLTFMDDLIDC